MREGEAYHVEGTARTSVPRLAIRGRGPHVLRDDTDSFRMARKLARTEGILAGGSTGTILCATLEYAGRWG